jgi:predicted Zn-dependent protease
MKKIKILLTILFCVVMFSTCTVDDPLTGKTTLAIIGNDALFPMAFDQYKEVLNDARSNGKEVTSGSDYEMVQRLGDKISKAAEKWYESITGDPNYLYKQGYRWEYHLIDDKQVNAWCMPGGKIVVYTGILPVTGGEDALAVVMGHEVSHALLNHGQQRVSTNLLAQGVLTVASLGAALTIKDQQTQALFLGALGLGANLGVILPFTRDNESEADHYGLILMAIAGYNPDAALPFWEKMAKLSPEDPLFKDILSTHPSSSSRSKAMDKLAPEAKKRAAKLRIDDLKASIPQAKRIAAEINGE